MALICPSVTANNLHQFRSQIERVVHFGHRLHLDFMDGELAPSLSPPLKTAWWPAGVIADLHLMYQRPADYIDEIVELKPHLTIIHAEADGIFKPFAEVLKANNIKVGVALMASTAVDVITGQFDLIDHVLIFSGHLGYFGGRADLHLLEKVKQLKSINPNIEIGWDGGINSSNIEQLVSGGVDVLNVGGYLQRATDPEAAYAKLKDIITD